MEIEVVVTGYLEENCYVLKKDGQALIVDPGDEFFKIKENTKYIKFDIINEEKIYENKKTNLIYFHRTGFFMQISKGCIPYVIITELE